MPNQYSARRVAIIPIGPSIAYIPLTKEQFALIDSDDAEMLSRWQWRAQWSETTKSYYALREAGRGQVLMMQRQIVDGLADHRNRVTLDYRRNNLRRATTSQNCANRRKRKNKTGHTGIYRTENGRYRVQLRINGKLINLGNYALLEKAIEVRHDAANALFGEFAPTP